MWLHKYKYCCSYSSTHNVYSKQKIRSTVMYSYSTCTSVPVHTCINLLYSVHYLLQYCCISMISLWHHYSSCSYTNLFIYRNIYKFPFFSKRATGWNYFLESSLYKVDKIYTVYKLNLTYWFLGKLKKILSFKKTKVTIEYRCIANSV